MKPYVLTPARRAALGRNVLSSTGPRTAAGRNRASLNNLRHGLYSDRWVETMPAFGEDPKDFERLVEDLLREWRPRTAAGARLVRQLGVLYWKLERLGRAEAAMAAGSLEKRESERKWLHIATRGVELDNAYEAGADKGLSGLPDSPMKFRRMLRGLGRIRAALRRRDRHADYLGMLVEIYGDRPATSNPVPSGKDPAVAAASSEQPAPAELAPKLDYRSTPSLADEGFQDFERDVDAMRERVELAFARYRLRHRKVSPAERDAKLMPEGKPALLLIRRESSLMRQVDRTVRLLLLVESRPKGSRPDSSPAGTEPCRKATATSRVSLPPPRSAHGKAVPQFRQTRKRIPNRH